MLVNITSVELYQKKKSTLYDLQSFLFFFLLQYIFVVLCLKRGKKKKYLMTAFMSVLNDFL